MPRKTLLHILMHIGKLLSDQIAGELAQSGVHHGQGRVLMNLHRHGAMTQANLARGMNLKPATITTMLRPIEERGFIERNNDPKTNRAIIVSLTPTGVATAIQVQKTWAAIERKLKSALVSMELDDMFLELEALRDVLGGSAPQFIAYHDEENHS